jgi:rhodanese-related sulfurtransferase
MNSISVSELYALSQRQDVELIDVRTPEEFSEVHAAFARSVPMDTIDPHELVASRQLPADEPLYFICKMGGRSGRVCMGMESSGYPNVVNVEGGTEAWIAAGFPAGCAQASNAA